MCDSVASLLYLNLAYDVLRKQFSLIQYMRVYDKKSILCSELLLNRGDNLIMINQYVL